MGTFTRWYRDPQTGIAQPLSLFLTGALLAVEVQVPTPVAALLAQQGRPVPVGVAGLGLIDTGAMLTCVHEAVFTSLGMLPVGVVTMGTAGGTTERPTYPARLVFPEIGWNYDVPAPVVSVDLSGQTITFSDQQPQQVIMLIGRDLLSGCVLVWNGVAATWSLSY